MLMLKLMCRSAEALDLALRAAALHGCEAAIADGGVMLHGTWEGVSSVMLECLHGLELRVDPAIARRLGRAMASQLQVYVIGDCEVGWLRVFGSPEALELAREVVRRFTPAEPELEA